MKPISTGVRLIIVAAKERGENVEDIAKWAGVCSASVYNILRLHKQTQSVKPKKHPGRKPRLTAEQLEQIRELIERENDLTLAEIIERLVLPIKKSRLSEIIISMGLTYKKKLCIRSSSRERMS